jgi:segregation and condensation protein A
MTQPPTDPNAAPPEEESAAEASAAPEKGEAEDFDAPVRVDPSESEHEDSLVVDISGYEGPLDVLLDLARHQKVDIRKISMVALVDQYLLFVEAAKQRNLELAADYLVMASWLAYLKTKLLLPAIGDDGDEPVEDLQNLPQEGQDFFTRGAPEGVRVTQIPEWQADLVELLKAYATQRIAAVDRDYHIQPPAVFSIEAARMRLERILGSIPEWTELTTLTRNTEVDAPAVSVLASSFNAALEFAKAGQIDLKQLGSFEPIYVKTRPPADEEGAS